ncbi:MAG: CinA family protein [Thermoplasmata archaeon]
MREISELSEMLKARRLKIAVAESCTGGHISDVFTDIPGASGFFVLGMVAYTKEAKERILGVAQHTIEKYGVVSREVCAEMCVNVKVLANADIGIATTGYASPGKNVRQEDVGKVFVGFCWEPQVPPVIFELKLQGTREEIKSQVAMFVIKKLSELLGRRLST